MYLGGAKPSSKEENAYVDDKSQIILELIESNDKVNLKTNIYDFIPKTESHTISSAILGQAFEPEQRFEDPQGREIIFNEDYFGSHRCIHPLVGPFETEVSLEHTLF